MVACHAVGDLVLQDVARRLLACVRAADSVGRIGGDEFVVQLVDIGTADAAVKVADEIRAALKRPLIVADQSLCISSSIGVALYPDHGRDDVELANHADCAMYQAKASGRDRVQVFTASMLAVSRFPS